MIEEKIVNKKDPITSDDKLEIIQIDLCVGKRDNIRGTKHIRRPISEGFIVNDPLNIIVKK